MLHTGNAEDLQCGRAGRLSALTLIVIALLSGCGFTPVKTLEASAYAPVYVAGQPSAIQRALRASLAAQDALSKRATGASSIARFQDIRFETNDFSVTSDGRVAEYETTVSARFVWEQQSQNDSSQDGAATQTPATVLLDLQLSSIETFSGNPLNPGAETAEKQQIRSRLEQSLVRKALRAMSLVSTASKQAE